MAELPLSPDEVRDELVARKVKLHHAIDLPDFETYCREWALLARQQLEECGGVKVPFYTDDSDHEKALYDRCFGNFTQFWRLFWELPFGGPNSYGLVTLVFRPEALAACSDVAVTTRGANAEDFDLAKDRIASKEALALAFAGAGANGPKRMVEFSTATNRLSFDLLERIIVQPVDVGGRRLLDAVQEMVDRFAGGRRKPTVVEEPAARGRPGHKARLDSLLSWVAQQKGEVRLRDIEGSLPALLKEWFGELKAKGNLVPFCKRAFATLEMLGKRKVTASPAPEATSDAR